MRILVLLPLAMMLTACASTTHIKTRYQHRVDLHPAHHILLAAQSPVAKKRIRWESICAQTLQRPGLRISLAHRVLAHRSYTDSSELEEWARQHNADAILLADITGLLTGPAHLPDRTPRQRPQWIVYFGGEGPNRPENDIIQKIQVKWIAPNGQYRWTGLARTHEAHSLEAVVESQCSALGELLTRKGFLPSS